MIPVKMGHEEIEGARMTTGHATECVIAQLAQARSHVEDEEAAIGALDFEAGGSTAIGVALPRTAPTSSYAPSTTIKLKIVDNIEDQLIAADFEHLADFRVWPGEDDLHITADRFLPRNRQRHQCAG